MRSVIGHASIVLSYCNETTRGDVHPEPIPKGMTSSYPAQMALVANRPCAWCREFGGVSARHTLSCTQTSTYERDLALAVSWGLLRQDCGAPSVPRSHGVAVASRQSLAERTSDLRRRRHGTAIAQTSRATTNRPSVTQFHIDDSMHRTLLSLISSPPFTFPCIRSPVTVTA